MRINSEKRYGLGWLALCMAFLLLITSLSIFSVDADHTEVAFSEDFSDQSEEALKEKGWVWYQTTGPLSFDNGRLVLFRTDSTPPGQITMHLSGNADAKNWTDYTVETDLTFDADKSNLLQATNVSAVAIRSSGRNKGYEFGLSVSKDLSKTTLRFRNMVAKKNLKDVNGVDAPSFPIELGKTYRVKVEAIGNHFKCYIDDALVMEVIDADNAHPKGSIGLTVGKNKTYFDNVVVKTEPTTTETDPTEPSKPAEPDYSWFQPSEKEIPDNALFSENFSGDKTLTEKGWNSNSPLLKDGHAFFETSSTDEGKQMLYLNQLAGAADWNQYILEADVSISAQFAGSLATNTAGIVTKTSGKDDGYEFSLCITQAGDTYVRLYDRNTKTELKRQEFAVQAGNIYRLKIAHTGETIRCSVDGSLLIEVADDATRKGSVGLRTGGVLVGYDNVVVFPYTKLDGGNETDFGEGYYFKEYFTAENALTDRGWSSDLPEIVDGQLKMTSEITGCYLNGKPAYTSLTDYTVDADVFISDQVTGNYSTYMLCLVARTTGLSNGYEYGICFQTNGKKYVRLYDRKAKKALAQVDMDLEPNKAYHMSMTVEGSNITCYLDGKEVITASAESCPTGSIGFRVNGYTSYCSNIEVKKLGGGAPTTSTEPSGSSTTTAGGEQTGTTTTMHNVDTGSASPIALPLLLAAISLAAVAGHLLLVKKEELPEA